MKTKIILIMVLLIGIAGIVYSNRDQFIPYFFRPVQQKPSSESIKNTTSNIKDNLQEPAKYEIIAKNLNIPWEIAFLPTNDILVTERSGKLIKIGTETKVIKEIEGVRHVGEGGLLGLAVHPKFATNNYIYLYSTTQDSSGVSNRLERYKLINDVLSDRQAILTGIKGSSNHDGGRIAFGPDGYLYITTGDAEISNLAQDTKSLNGKILRIKDDGSVPADNPFGNAVYSFGHRNPQGLAWDDNGNLWATEHGPSGSQTGYDEVNFITKGANYGWPVIKGDEKKDGMVVPVIHSGSSDTWAPAGLVYKNGSLFFTGLRGQALYEAKIQSVNKLELATHFKQEFGRLRAIVQGPDGAIYVSTSNKDGRGRTKSEDDKIIKIDPNLTSLTLP